MKDIIDNLNKHWNWYYISYNSNIKMKDIINNPDKPWHWKAISSKPFTKDKEEFQMKKYKEHIATVLNPKSI